VYIFTKFDINPIFVDNYQNEKKRFYYRSHPVTMGIGVGHTV
jgi:hypothetical protein